MIGARDGAPQQAALCSLVIGGGAPEGSTTRLYVGARAATALIKHGCFRSLRQPEVLVGGAAGI